jgi:rhodanese-related sulfurtransferase
VKRLHGADSFSKPVPIGISTSPKVSQSQNCTPEHTALQENLGRGGILHELAGAKRLVFYFAFGERSAMAVQAAQDAGLKSACHIHGGLAAWRSAGGPVSK